MIDSLLPWILFHVFIIIFLSIDLFFNQRKGHLNSFKESILWSGLWITVALLFNVSLLFFYGKETALNFLAGYLIEKSLSIDNLFVFILIFAHFKIPENAKHKILFWGIISALLMRALFIFGGIELIHRFEWLLYVFGAFLIFTGAKMALHREEAPQLENNRVLQFFLRWIPYTTEMKNTDFFIKKGTQYLATPLFLALIAVEITDVIFALDSIPAIFAITLDPFIVYTSNILAILGLRALFLALSGFMRLFDYLHYGLAAILVFVGMKMILEKWIHIPIGITFTVIASIIGLSIFLSIWMPKSPKIS